jgi:eukaryotic-like serine/threonine-protein kinase
LEIFKKHYGEDNVLLALILSNYCFTL